MISMSVISMQFRATLLILLVLLLRSLFLYKLPKKVFLGLWAVVLIRILIPFNATLTAGFSFPDFEGRLLSFLFSGSAAVHSSEGANAVLYSYTVPWFFIGIWLAGALGLLGWFLVSHIRGRRVYRFACPVRSEAVKQWKENNQIRRNVRVLQCPELSSALTYGLFRPVILLPRAMEEEDPRRRLFVLSHELEHIRHFDILWKWVSALVLCLNWFNPMVWAMHILLNRDMELYCDERVLKREGFTKQAKTEYAMALLALAEKKGSALSFASHFSKSAVEERVLSVMHGRLAPALFIGLALFGIMLLAFFAFANFVMYADIGYTMPLNI